MAGVVSRLGLEIAIQAFHAAGETAAVVRLADWRDPKVRSWLFRHSRHDPALVVRERALKPFAWRWRIDQGIEEDAPVPLGEDERLMLRMVRHAASVSAVMQKSVNLHWPSGARVRSEPWSVHQPGTRASTSNSLISLDSYCHRKLHGC